MKIKLQIALINISESLSFSKKFWAACFSMVLMSAILQGCGTGNVGSIQGISNVGGDPTLGQTATFQVIGTGVCGRLLITFGDGSPPIDLTNQNLASSPIFQHTYVGWGGGKVVRAQGSNGCSGNVQTSISVDPVNFNLGFGQPTPTFCNFVPGKPALPKNAIVHIKKIPNSKTWIDFGCNIGGCGYDADGINPSSADSSLPFPGFRVFSLILRVGTQVVQGGTDMQFTTNQAGKLEVCVNDANTSDNKGAWGILIYINELGP